MIGNFIPPLRYVFFVCLWNASLAQSNGQLATADSLFTQQKYTEALDMYTDIFSARNVTESMLIKMAFIEEGLGDYVQALYYFDQYYKLTADKSVLLKMQELAEENKLNGYRVEDKDFFLNLLNLYLLEIQLTLLLVSIFLLVFTYQFRKKRRMPIGMSMLQLIVLLTLLMLSNSWIQQDTKIIQSPTLLMSGPSAGAEPVGWVNEGHKVDIVDKFEMWTKIRWESTDVYIRNSKLK